jgi:hypothetical protein
MCAGQVSPLALCHLLIGVQCGITVTRHRDAINYRLTVSRIFSTGKTACSSPPHTTPPAHEVDPKLRGPHFKSFLLTKGSGILRSPALFEKQYLQWQTPA